MEIMQYFTQYCNGVICAEIIKGLFILFTAIVTALFAIHKYQAEQRISRLQKLYFEDTLLGQAKSIEETMSQTNKNRLMLENAFNLMINLLNRNSLDINLLRQYLDYVFESTFRNIEINVNSTEFKKETISKLLYDAGERGSVLATWTKEFDDDAYRYSSLLKSQILILKPDILTLTDDNKELFKDRIQQLLFEYVEENYVLIKRHYVLFHLLSDLVLEFSSVNYKTVKNILAVFKKGRIKDISQLINESYKELVSDVSTTYIGNISEKDAGGMEEKIKCVREKIFNKLNKNK